ncbi:hypothetical protein Poli38472_008567 [Pythium oligandrum]|uniref:EF-hand domain-containing protein n=1 Tax=Pythium oligandrum TaxID=41045 RepID=A0A8K1FCK6_PYTOL|nr:hypothetical protein Poli38472_008567 [Pythium oligandrum]|eukprot:TMW55919.1 hypothetical protein Poli38472_008567 [Pythium oligandrum]
MGNALTSAVRDPASVALVEAVVPFDNLHVHEVEAYWRHFYDQATSFALTRAEFRAICTKTACFLNPGVSTHRVVQDADAAFKVFCVRHSYPLEGRAVVAESELMDALEFLSVIAFIADAPIEDKIDLIFDSWDMSEDTALDVEECTISLKSTLNGLTKALRPVNERSTDKRTLALMDDEDIELLAERIFREIAKVASSSSLNQITINSDQFRAYCTENKTARALFDLFHSAKSEQNPSNQDEDDESIDPNDISADEARRLAQKIEQGQEADSKTAGEESFSAQTEDPGDEFLAVKPWKGAIVPPTKVPALDKTAPVIAISLEWIFGYCAQDTKNSVRYGHSGSGHQDEIVYPAAAVGVVLNTKMMKQRHYLGHTDDVLSICLHPKQHVVASGEIGKRPKICVWDLSTQETLCVLQGFHQRGVLLLAFQQDSQLISIGGDDDHSIAVYESKDGWKSAVLKVSSKGNKAVPYHLTANPSSTTLDFVCCGEKYIDFWTSDGKMLSAKKALLGKKGNQQPFLVAEYLGSSGSVVVGTNDGHLYHFGGRDLSSVIRAHGSAVNALHFQAGSLVSGSKDGQVSVWSDKLKLLVGPFDVKDTVLGSRPMYYNVRSCCFSHDQKTILFGTLASEIYEIDAKTGKSVREDALVKAHFQGETWGLDTHPHKAQCCTVGDDHTLRVWDLERHKELRSVALDLPARCCAYSSDGKMIAVGFGDGSNVNSKAKSAAKKPSGGFAVFSEADLVKVKEPNYEPKKWVSDIKFSPDNRVLAVASHDTTVYFYDALKGFAKKHAFKKHTAYVTHIDFSSDGHHLQSTCGGYELLFSEVKSARHMINASSFRDERWNTMTSTLGWAVQGIWEEGSDGTDVNAVDRSKDGLYLATGDDFGKVKIFRYPCALEKASSVELHGHSSHVTNVRWSSHDRYILSVGGNDRCLFVWRHEKPDKMDYGLTGLDRDQGRVAAPVLDDVVDTRDDDPLDVLATEEDIGDEFMAVKPWLGAIVPPSDSKSLKIINSAPDTRLELERVHGYQGQNASNNALYDSSGKVVYHAAAIGIVFDKTSQRQAFFKHHDDDIMAFCAHPNGTTFATAQMGKKPKIYTWNSNSPASSISCLDGFHQRFVSTMSFSLDGKKLGSVGGDDDHSVAIYNWQNGILVASAKGERSNVLAMCFHAEQWITCGDKHVRFWREQGKNLTSKKAIFGKANHKDGRMPGVFESVVSFGANAVVGASNGDLYIFQSSNELSKIVRGHSASLSALYASTSGNELITGSKDGSVKLWDSQLACISAFDLKSHAPSLQVLNPAIRSVCLVAGSRSFGTLLIGTAGSDLIEIDTTRSTPACTVITRGHSELELWGLACHPTRPEYCTTGDDGVLRVWDLHKKTQLRAEKFGAMARACAIFHGDTLDVIAVGLGGRHAANARNAKAQAKTGTILLLSYADISKPLFEDKPSKQPISDVKFAPNGSVLAVGSHDHNIYLYAIQDNFKKVTKAATFSKHTSYITHFDFSADSRFLQSNCGAYELLFSDPATGKQITSASSTKDVKWGTWTCVLGWPVQGIWPPCSDGTEVNAVDRSAKGDLLVSGDDFGLVKLFRYPCVTKNASSADYRGHSSHVTNVRWAVSDTHVISVGGNDRCVMEWKVCRDNEEPSAEIAEEIEIEEAAEVEESIDEPEGDEFLAVKPWLGAIVAPSNAPTPNTREPDLHIDLDWVYGYHTELSKQNLMYNSYGEIVYHTAAVGVIYDAQQHLQRHHQCHNDDIMSFTMSPKRNVVATGERGKRPVIRLWDAHTGVLLSEIKGAHARGVVSLAFSSDATKLASVGDDDDHSVALWEDSSHGAWKQPKAVAAAKGDKGVNYFASFGSGMDSLVTGGAKHVLFWRVEGKTMQSKRGKLGKTGTLQLFPSGCGFGDDFVTGTASGELYVWRGDTLSKAVKAHDGESTVVYAQNVSTGRDSSLMLLSGGKDGRIIMWNASYQCLKMFDLGSMGTGCLNKALCSLSLDSNGRKILVGTASSDIFELEVASETVLNGGKPVVSGHFALELWGLAVHPNAREFTTTGDDATLRTWDMDTKQLLSVTKLPTKARACAYSPDAALLAVGLGGDNGVRRKGKAAKSKEGGIIVLSTSDNKIVFEDQPAKEWISDVKFSPCGQLVGFGSHDNALHLYSCRDTDLKKRKPFAKHSSYITHFDFSHDSKYIQSNCGAYELLFCDTSTSDQVRSATSVRNVNWATWTCTLGWPVQGIWPECADGTDVNSVCASSSRTILATGDDACKVKLFRYPCTIKGVMRDEMATRTMSSFFIDPKDLPQDGYGLSQVLFLGAVYGFVLFNASNMISDGSELLLLVPAMAGIVGSVVLPVLGAVPDGAIVLFSGMGPNAQEQVSVGVGALAGSTIMLLTIPWALSILAGRVNLDEQGRGSYIRPKNAPEGWSKLTPHGNMNLFKTGVVLFDEIRSNARTMIVTSLIYLILQIPAFQYTGTHARDAVADHEAVAKAERPFAFVAFVVSMAAFFIYLYWNVKRSSKVAEDVIDEIRVQAIRNGEISLSGVLSAELVQMKRAKPDSSTALNPRALFENVADIIRPFFHAYDKNRDNRIDADELQFFFKDMGETITREEALHWMKEADKDNSGFVEFNELVEAAAKYLVAKYETEQEGRVVEMKQIHVEVPHTDLSFANNDDDEAEEDEEIPEDLAHLSISEQQRKIKLRAAYLMFVGTALVLIFSDPMVDVLSEVGARTGIPAFYVSFVVAPLASNASELIAAYNYAQKKTSKTISISISALLGAACMNNTFCLGIFAALLYFKGGLVWEFSAETIAILMVELVMGYFAMKKTQRLFDGLIVFLLYPASICLVFFLENVIGLD